MVQNVRFSGLHLARGPPVDDSRGFENSPDFLRGEAAC